MNVQLIACNVGVSPAPGVQSYAAQFQGELRKLGGKGATEGANNFAWYPSDGKVLVAPDKGGVTWNTVTSQNVGGMAPDTSKLGGYNTFGTPQPAGVMDWGKYLWNKLFSDSSSVGGSPLPASGQSSGGGGK